MTKMKFGISAIFVVLFVLLYIISPSYSIGVAASSDSEVETEELEDVCEAPTLGGLDEDVDLEDLFGFATSVEKIVTISGYVQNGMVYLTSQLTGFDDCTIILYQWFCDLGDGYTLFTQTEVGECSFVYDRSLEGSRWKLYVMYRQDF